MSRQRVAVFGGGHLGTIHARLLQEIVSAELVAIVEPNLDRAAELQDQFDCPVANDVTAFAHEGTLDGAVIAAPTPFHHQIGLQLLERGVHVLMEKPLAATPAQCDELVRAADAQRVVLQVGHVERFNPAWTTICNAIGVPRFVAAVREGPLTFRSMDAGVVLDLMIHDIDLVLSIVPSKVVSVQAIGFDWTGPAEDIAQARLTFANGCVAQLSASRVACEPQRRMRIYGNDSYGDVDFAARSCQIVEARNGDWQSREYSPSDRADLSKRLYQDVLRRRQLEVPDANPILDELQDFVTSMQHGRTPIVSGRDGLMAVEIADEVIRRVRQRASPAEFRPPTRRAG